MNSDTQRQVHQILDQGWYRQEQALGEGGWRALYRPTFSWKRYHLNIPSEERAIQIVAQDDQTAIQAFHNLYDLGDVPYEIVEKIVSYRSVEDNLNDKDQI